MFLVQTRLKWRLSTFVHPNRYVRTERVWFFRLELVMLLRWNHFLSLWIRPSTKALHKLYLLLLLTRQVWNRVSNFWSGHKYGRENESLLLNRMTVLGSEAVRTTIFPRSTSPPGFVQIQLTNSYHQNDDTKWIGEMRAKLLLHLSDFSKTPNGRTKRKNDTTNTRRDTWTELLTNLWKFRSELPTAYDSLVLNYRTDIRY